MKSKTAFGDMSKSSRKGVELRIKDEVAYTLRTFILASPSINDFTSRTKANKMGKSLADTAKHKSIDEINNLPLTK